MLAEIASELSREGGTLILLHGNADPDAVASAFAVRSCYPDSTICTPGGLDRLSKLLCAALGIETVGQPGTRGYARTLVLDTSGPEQLDFAIDLSNAIVVDHHMRNDRWASAKLYYCDDSKSSCSEIVLEMLRGDRKTVSREVALALMYGILTDTGYFKFARAGALTAFADLMEMHSIQMDEAMGLVGVEMDISERVSQLKGAQRLKYWKVGDYIVAVSQGSAYEASVCKALLALGADIAFVGSQRGESFRVSARADPAMVRKGLHLGQLLGDVGHETTNGGGGHPGAAGISGVGDVEAILNIAAENALRFLKGLSSSRD
ncbi:MAG: DHH family phosphoesterase [Thermoplasmata archaeon]